MVLPAAERWFVAALSEALPLVNDPKLADAVRGFLGQEAIHAEVHEQVLHEIMIARGVDPAPILQQVDYLFGKVLAPSTSDDPKRGRNRHRLWLLPRQLPRRVEHADVLPPGVHAAGRGVTAQALAYLASSPPAGSRRACRVGRAMTP